MSSISSYTYSEAKPSCAWSALDIHLECCVSVFWFVIADRSRLELYRVVYRGISNDQVKQRRVVYSINSLFMRLQPLFVTADVPGTAPWR